MLILASGSPRRHELLLAAGIEHIVRPSNTCEARNREEPPEGYVARLAREKADAVEAAADDVVLGADTIVCLEGMVLGKPADRAEAAGMLRQLSGRDHRVITGIYLKRGDVSVSDISKTRVWFYPLSEDEIAEYVSTEEPMDKAGAYAIQGGASRFVQRIEGCYHNIVGLPVPLVYRHLKCL